MTRKTLYQERKDTIAHHFNQARALALAAKDAADRGMESRAVTLLGYAEHHIAVLEQEQALIGLMQRLKTDSAFEQVGSVVLREAQDNVTGHMCSPVEEAAAAGETAPVAPHPITPHKPKRMTKKARQVAAGQIGFLEGIAA